MNLLTKNELVINNERYGVQKLSDFFDDELFLEQLGSLPYNKLSREQAVRVDLILDKITRNTSIIIDLAGNNFYNGRLFRIIYKLLYVLKGEEFDGCLTRHYELMEDYVLMADCALKVIEDKSILTIDNVELAYEFSLLGVFSVLSDLSADNRELLNLRRYGDCEDDMENLKRTTRVDGLTLKMKCV